MRSESPRRRAHRLRFAALSSLLAVLASGPGTAQDVPAESLEPGATDEFPAEPAGPGATDEFPAEAAGKALEALVFEVDRFIVDYREPHAQHPPLSEILPLEVEFGRTASGYVAPTEGVPTETLRVGGGGLPEPRKFHASGIVHVNREILDALRERGLIGVYVIPHREDITFEGLDLRPPGETNLRLQVWTGRVQEVRTVGRGPRVSPEWRVNNKVHRRIRQLSPIRPPGQGGEETSDLLQKDVLEDYLFQLNRHPGRYVEAALSPSPDGEGVALDYQVNEAKPWFIYGQVGNTGTSETNKWQQRYGFVHRQLTNNDDILSLEYGNTGFKNVHNVRVQYESPWFRHERASWLRSKDTDPGWVNRDIIPWWGADKLRWSANFNWSRFEAENVSDSDEYEGQEFAGGLGLTYNAYQHRAFFVDLTLGFQLRHISVLNSSILADGPSSELLFLPTAGVRLERFNEYSSYYAGVRYEVNGAGTKDSSKLGRVDTDGFYQVLHWDAGASHYLEPLLFRNAWLNPNTPFSSTLAHEISFVTRGQYGFNHRLIPQASDVIGGLYSVRGYPQSEAVGDSVYIASAEYRFHLPRVLPIRRKATRVPLMGDFRFSPQQVYGRTDWDLIFTAFIDAGTTVRNRPESGLLETDSTQIGAGAGVELRFKQNFRVRFDWGHALRTTYRLEPNSSDPNLPPIGVVDTPKGNDEFYLLFSVLF